MKISYNWLKEYVDINVTPEKVAELLTMHSFEIESVIYQGKGLENVVVGEVLEKKKHSDADRLNIVKVKVGSVADNRGSAPVRTGAEPLLFLEIVCGAPNIDVGQKVPVALVGADLPNGMKIEKRKVKGVESNGMVCSEDELGLGKVHEGIIVLDKNMKIGTPAKEALGLDDVIFDINILPNRAHDCLSHIGVAREVAALVNEKLKIKNEKLKLKAVNNSEFLNVKIEDKKLCRRYSAAVMKNVEIKESPEWLKKRLENCGIRPINNVVDITSYVMLALGQPMHAFDADKISRNQELGIMNQEKSKAQTKKIIIRTAERGEKILALDDKTYELTENDSVIASRDKPIAIAGVMGGAETAVDEKTKNIIFESANFYGANIRKTSQRLKLSSESSYRFEREIDPGLTIKAIEMAIKLAKDLAGGKLEGSVIDVYPNPVKEKEIKFDFDRIENLLGIKIEKKKIKEILSFLEFVVVESGKSLKVKVPSYRIDVERVNDVIEEIGRIYGYENIPETLSLVEMKSVAQGKSLAVEKEIKKIMEGMGFTETYNYSFLGKKDIDGVSLNEEDHFELQNPLNEEFKFLRTSMLSGLLKNVYQNLKQKDNFKLFELARVYLKKDENLPDEKKILAGVVIGKTIKDNLFYEVKGQTEILFSKLGFDNLNYKEIINTESFWHKGRSAEIFYEKKAIGKIGEIHPITLTAFDVETRVAYFEIYLENIGQFYNGKKRYKKINRFPSIELDLSFVFDERISWEEIGKAILDVKNDLIKNIEPFDIYRGASLGEGKKSIAFRIKYQAEDRTLKDEEVKAVQEKAIKELEKLGGEVRK